MKNYTLKIKPISRRDERSWKKILLMSTIGAQIKSGNPELVCLALEACENIIREHVTVDGGTVDEWLDEASLDDVQEVLKKIQVLEPDNDFLPVVSSTTGSAQP